MKLSVILIILAIITLPTVSAELTLDTSCDSESGNYQELLHNGSSIVINNSFTCANGCADNGLECDAPARPEAFMAFAIVFGLAAFTFGYIALRLPETYGPLQIMFLAFSVLYVAFGAYVVSGFALLTLNDLNAILVQSYIVGLMTVLAIVFYIIYLLVRRLLEYLLKSKQAGRPFKW